MDDTIEALEKEIRDKQEQLAALRVASAPVAASPVVAPTAPSPVEASTASPSCPLCHKPATYIEDYEAWYCHDCSEYVPRDQV